MKVCCAVIFVKDDMVGVIGFDLVRDDDFLW
jgi:hypothetical protein